MKLLGTVIRVTTSRNLLVKLPGSVGSDPKDLKVVTNDLRFIGVMRDVIGRVKDPYALVKVIIPIEEAKALIGEKIYVLSPNEEKSVLQQPKNL